MYPLTTASLKVQRFGTKYFFSETESVNYSIFRILFYLLLFFFYELHLGNSSWIVKWSGENLDTDAHWVAISFFKLINLKDLPVTVIYWITVFWKVALLCCAAGFGMRIFAPIAFIAALFMFGLPLNYGKIHHINHMPTVVLGIMAFVKYSGRISFDHLLAKFVFRRQGNPKISSEYNWPVKMIWLYMGLVYFAAGFQKLRFVGLDWIFSDNMAAIILTRTPLPEFGHWVAQHDILCWSLAFTTVFGELFFFTALFKKWARIVFVPTLFLMHIGSYLVMGVHALFFPYLICYVFWVPWKELGKILHRLSFLRIAVFVPILWFVGTFQNCQFLHYTIPVYLVYEYMALFISRREVNFVLFFSVFITVGILMQEYLVQQNVVYIYGYIPLIAVMAWCLSQKTFTLDIFSWKVKFIKKLDLFIIRLLPVVLFMLAGEFLKFPFYQEISVAWVLWLTGQTIRETATKFSIAQKLAYLVPGALALLLILIQPIEAKGHPSLIYLAIELILFGKMWITRSSKNDVTGLQPNGVQKP